MGEGGCGKTPLCKASGGHRGLQTKSHLRSHLCRSCWCLPAPWVCHHGSLMVLLQWVALVFTLSPGDLNVLGMPLECDPGSLPTPNYSMPNVRKAHGVAGQADPVP